MSAREINPPATTPGFSFYEPENDGEGRNWLVAMFGSTALYALLGVGLVLLGTATKQVIEEKKIDLTFVEKVAKPEPPPPPPPKVEVAKVEPAPPPKEIPKPKPAASQAVVRPDQKIRKLDKPPPPKAFVAPKEMPLEAAPEADPSEDKGIAVYGEPGEGDPAGLEGGVASGVAGGIAGGSMALPEDATPPVPSRSNQRPPYPQEARVAGRTGTVVLKVVVRADGTVGEVEVLRGEEPFVAAAIAAVKSWRYEPALHKGQPITVYRIIQMPFKLVG